MRVRVVGVLVGLAVAAGVCCLVLTAPGLRAEYFGNATWSGEPARVAVDRAPSAADITRAWGGAPPGLFSVKWSGYLVAGREGDHTFTLASDDGSQLFVDGRLIVDNLGTHGGAARSGRAYLDAGPHAIVLDYIHAGGPPALAWAWAPPGEGSEPVPGWRLSPQRSPAGLLLARRLSDWLWPYVTVAALLGVGRLMFPQSVLSRVVHTSERSALADAALVAAALAWLSVATPFTIDGDGAVRFEALSRLLSGGSLSPMAYSMIGPLASAPLWWLGRTGGTSEWWCARFNFFLFVFGLAGFYLALTPEIDRRRVVRFLLILVVASMFPHHDSRYYGEVFTALLVGVGLALVTVKRTAWGWVPAVLGAANTPATIVGLALVAADLARRRRDVRHLLPIVAAAGLVMAEAWWRRGGPLVTGYEGNAGAETLLPYSGRPGFSYPLVLGLLSITLSFGKGLVFFAPGLVLIRRLSTWARAERDLIVSWLLFLVGLVFVYSKWWAWYGGVFWGPRFVLFASIPAAFALAARRGPATSIGGELAAAGCLLWSAWVGLSGLLFGAGTPDICTANHYALELLCWYTPEYSPLLRPFVVPPALGTEDLVTAGLFAVVALYLAVPRLVAAARHARPGIVRER